MYMYYEYTYILTYVRTPAGTNVRSLKSLFASSACLKKCLYPIV